MHSNVLFFQEESLWLNLAYQSEEKGGVPGATTWLLAAVEADARAHGIDPETASWND